MLPISFLGKSPFYVFQKDIQVASNNIMNAQTIGFKKRRLELESVFPNLIEQLVADDESVPNNIRRKRRGYEEYGRSLRILDITKDFSNGTYEMTNRELDFAIQGKGMFQFILPDGSYVYSRAGNLRKDHKGILQNPNGHPLEPSITIPVDAMETVVNSEGKVFARYSNKADMDEIGQIQIARFDRVGQLKPIGQNLFKPTDDSGEAVMEIPGDNDTGTLQQRSLEQSNVNIIEEMMSLLFSQRSYQFASQAMDSAKSMLQKYIDFLE